MASDSGGFDLSHVVFTHNYPPDPYPNTNFSCSGRLKGADKKWFPIRRMLAIVLFYFLVLLALGFPLLPAIGQLAPMVRSR
jgi:hypothetical protein